MAYVTHRSFNNHSALAQARVAGCYACLSVFAPEQVVRWTFDDTTAVCPHCGVDAVLPGADDPAELLEARALWYAAATGARVDVPVDDDDQETRPAVFSPLPE